MDYACLCGTPDISLLKYIPRQPQDILGHSQTFLDIFGNPSSSLDIPSSLYKVLVIVTFPSKTIKLETFQCPNCPKVFDRNYKLKTHLIVHNSSKPFVCLQCNSTFKTNSALRRHIRELHEQTRKYTCTECDKVFNSKTNYVIHQKRHLFEFKVRCEHCNEGFVTHSEYRRHLDAKHNQKRYVCDICGKNISSERHLKAHKKLHEANYEAVYFQECGFCNKRFRHLKKHIRESHEGLGHNYVCPTCGKTFRSENSFKVHQMIHKGIRPYECQCCHKQFYSKQYLTVHWRTHTGEKPFQCIICGKSFSQKSPLKIHMRLHTGERPYECDVCEEKFVSKQKLTFHLKSAHQIVDFRNGK
ncbi:unnamed protein product [Ceutorhynchus assimilis]|uniref:C2H2-type domain-containing protein n=1 Tax=Ceutorhynchus assimilis TaxID=467358 RepID=A0A9N9MG81_9CUCU|nr:unnamed protein product [Ceutorhynchus assimilis]